jgi:hypothetical protein
MMKSIAPVFFASPQFDITSSGALGILLVIGLVPIFIVSALNGHAVFLGIFQLVVLCLTEAAQWRFTRHARAPIKVLSAGVTYLIINVAVTIGVMYCLSHFPRLGSYLYGK